MAVVGDEDLVSHLVAEGGMLDTRVSSILNERKRIANLSDEQLTERAHDQKWLARGGAYSQRSFIETFALASEATRRLTGKSHFPEQIHAGIKIFSGCIAEMQTGEGKTITAVLPVVLRAFKGRGCHVVTANEYLAKRDAEHLSGVYQLMGLSIACITTDMDDQARADAYRQDVVYTTAGEVGFDFLRDCMKRGTEGGSENGAGAIKPVHRDFHFALVDEADSILIDDARTPLIIGAESKDEDGKQDLCRWACHFSCRLKAGEHFILIPQRRSVELSEYGCRFVLLMCKPTELRRFNNEEIFQYVEQALVAKYYYLRERDYIVMEDESVVIVDEGSGRIMEERKWQRGLHQAIEAKENVPFSPVNSTVAKLTLQTLFRKYEYLAGMTGTAYLARQELKTIYNLRTHVIPTHRRCIRRRLPTRVFLDLASKHAAIAGSVVDLIENGRSVLIGTPSVEASEALSLKLTGSGIQHRVLNCRAHAQEADIVARAGQPQAVTIATNMAGRGTDILLHEAVRRAGGLHVIATERHSSARIDRQLVGRCARQGDPGSFQFFLSLEDELLRAIRVQRRQRMIEQARPKANASGELPVVWERVFDRTQRTIERIHLRMRKQLLKHEKDRLKSFNKMSLDPYIELLHD